MSAQTLDPAPAVPTQPAAGYDEVLIRVRRYRARPGVEISTVEASDYVVLAHGPTQIAQALEQVWCEHRIAAYAAARGEVYDRALHDEAAERLALQGRQLREGQVLVLRPAITPRMAGTVTRRRRTPRVHDVSTWRPLPAGTVTLRSGKVAENVQPGSWESPAGRVYLRGARITVAVVAKRRSLGLAVKP